MNHLEMVLGMLAEDIDEDFKAIDENGDSLVSKEEGFKAYGNFGLDRSEGSIYPGGKWKMENYRDIPEKTDRDDILRFARNNRNKNYNGKLQNDEYLRFSRDMSSDLRDKYGYGWTCLTQGNMGLWWGTDMYFRQSFTLKDNDVVLICWHHTCQQLIEGIINEMEHKEKACDAKIEKIKKSMQK